MTLQYWTMLPIAALVATVSTASGVGGATIFTPLFVLALRVSPEVAIGVGLVTEVFGFASGLVAYARERLVDYRLGLALLMVTIPAAVLGALVTELIEPEILKAILGVGLFAVAANAFRAPSQEHVERLDAAIEQEYGGDKGQTCLITWEDERICYTVCNRTEGRLVAALGALFKGMIATGLGEMNEDFLLERCHVPSRVSVATGVFVVLFTTLSAAVVHLVRFAFGGGHELTAMLSLIVFTIPGVVLGGQLGPWVVEHLPPRELEVALRILHLLLAALTLGEVVL
jgi:hypothetical protein